MTTRYVGGFITKAPIIPTTSSASGIWTLDQATQYIKAGTWPIAGKGCSTTFVSPGTYTWVAPTGVTSVSVVAVGAGGYGNTGCKPCTGFGLSLIHI